MRQRLSDIEKLGCGCHTRALKPISVSCVCRGAEAKNNQAGVSEAEGNKSLIPGRLARSSLTLYSESEK